MQYSVRIHEAAMQDLGDILQSLAARDKSRALALLEELVLALNSPQALFQNALAPQDEDLLRLGFRYAPVHAVTLYFRVLGSTLTVHRVIPGRQKENLLLR